MGLIMLLKKIGVLVLLISASLLSTSLAGRQSTFVKDLGKKMGATHEGVSREQLEGEEKVSKHERVLRVNTKDYGSYDPAPALAKPPFKLIPN